MQVTDFYIPLPHQTAFHNSMCPYRLLVGGVGSGKTFSLLMEGLLSCLMVPGSMSLILRTTSPDIQRTVINQFLDTTKIPASIYRNYNKNEKIAYFHNGSQLHFGYCQRNEDVMQYLSTQYIFIGLEEGGEFNFPIWEMLTTRARSPKNLFDIHGHNVQPSICIATNPFGNGWNWIRSLFVDHHPMKGMGTYDPDDYFYTHSTIKDNPYLYTPEYMKKLEGLTGTRRKQLLEGDMYEIGGQYYTQFNTGQHEGIHVMDANKIEFRSYDPIWIGSDWDWAHWPVLWLRKGWIPDLVNGGKRCVNVVYRELIIQEQNAIQAAQEIARACPPNKPTGKIVKVKENIRSFFFSWERFKRQGQDHTISEQLGTELIKYGLPRPMVADNGRIDGWALIGQLLDFDELIITTDCPNVIATLPVLIHDKDNLGDVEKTESLEDDIADTLRYAVKSFLKPGRVPQAIKDQQVLDRIQDPMAKSIKAFEQYCRKQNPNGPIRDNRMLPWQVRG